MALADLKVAVAFGVDPLAVPAPADWTEISAYMRGASIRRGRQHELARTEAGTATIRLRNTDRRFDATNTASPYAPNVIPMRRVRVQALHQGTTYDLFQGYIEDWGLRWPPRAIKDTGDAEAVVSCVDAFKLLQLFELSAYSAEVLADSPVGYWKLDETSGTSAADSSGSAFNGTYTGGVTLNQAAALKGGQGAASFDGTDDRISGIGSPTALAIRGDATVEFWFFPTATPAVTGYIVYGLDPYAVSYNSQNKLVWAQTPASGVAYNLSAGPYALNSWRHVAVTRKRGYVRIYVNGALAAEGQASVDPAANFAFAIAANSVGASLFAGRIAHVAVYNTALPSERVAAHYAATFDTFIAQATGSHVNAILDAIGWPAGERVIDTGNSIIPISTPSGSALSWLLKVAEESENGLFQVRGDGKLLFHERHGLWKSPHNTAQATFGDGGGAELAYADLEPVFDDADLYTAVTVEREGGTAQRAEDAAARTKYGPRILEKTGLLISSDLEAADAANYLLIRFKEPVLRFRSLKVLGAADNSILAQLLGRDIHHDRITVKRRAPGGGTVTIQDAHIEGQQLDVTPGRPWEARWALVPADRFQFWLLGDATYSVLGSTTRLGY